MAGISIWQLLIIAVIIVLLFGTKKLRGMGSDLGGAVKGFKKAMEEEEPPAGKSTQTASKQASPAETESTQHSKSSSKE